jgi:hypothetical protein
MVLKSPSLRCVLLNIILIEQGNKLNSTNGFSLLQRGHYSDSFYCWLFFSSYTYEFDPKDRPLILQLAGNSAEPIIKMANDNLYTLNNDICSFLPTTETIMWTDSKAKSMELIWIVVVHSLLHWKKVMGVLFCAILIISSTCVLTLVGFLVSIILNQNFASTFFLTHSVQNIPYPLSIKLRLHDSVQTTIHILQKLKGKDLPKKIEN